MDSHSWIVKTKSLGLCVGYQMTNDYSHLTPRRRSPTEEIGLEIMTTATVSNTSFLGSPHRFQTRFHESTQNFKQVFTGANRSPHRSTDKNTTTVECGGLDMLGLVFPERGSTVTCRVAKTIGYLIFIGVFPQKSPIIRGSFLCGK